MMIPVLQMKKLRLEVVKQPVQVSQWSHVVESGFKSEVVSIYECIYERN